MSSWFGLPTPVEVKIENDNDGRHPAYRRRAYAGAAFTASKCPHDCGLENSCELPFGFSWTPMAVSNKHENSEKLKRMSIIKCGSDSLPPVLCLACLSYINPFAEIDKKTGIWICPLCGHNNALPVEELCGDSNIMAALTSDCVEYRQVVSNPDPSAEDKIEDNKNGRDNKLDVDDEDYCTYLLVVDENLSQKDGQCIASVVEKVLREQAINKNISEDAFSKIKLGLIVFGKSISIYQLGLSGMASADVYAPAEFDDGYDEFDEDIDKRAYIAEVQSDYTSLRNSLSSVFGIAFDKKETSASYSRMEMLSQKKASRLRKEECKNTKVIAKSPWLKRREESRRGIPKRCTGKALRCALDLANTSTSKSSRTSRIILFTNGCPNSGDGSVVNPTDSWEMKSKKKKGQKRATHSTVDTEMVQNSVEYFDTMTNLAVSFGIGIDVICCGANELALPVYQAIVDPSGGYVLPLVTLSTPQFEHNLRFILHNTYMSRSKYLTEDIDDICGAECILDIRSDSFVTPTQLCGSGQVLTELSCEMVETERLAFEEGSRLAMERKIDVIGLPSERALELSMTRIQMGRVDPLSTVTVFLEVDNAIGEDDDYAFFQLVSRYISRRGDEEITRVYSFKMPVAKDVDDFLGSVDDEAMSVVLAKAAVYRSLHGREEKDDGRNLAVSGDIIIQEKLSYDTQLDLDATIQRISGAFRLLDLEKNTQRKRSDKEISQSSLDFAFPPQLKETLNRLYHLRRGPLISPGPMRSIDDRAESRGLFIRFPVEDCLQMIRPSIWSTGSMQVSSGWNSMIEFPAETLALWDDSIIAADFHDGLFIWSGANCTAKRYDGIREDFKTHLLKISKNRFPTPEFYELKDGESMSRRFTPRLAPSHTDPIDNQIVHFPLLSTLKPAALEELRSKFKFYDENSDESFRTWFWRFASASNNSRKEGMSLCE